MGLKHEIADTYVEVWKVISHPAKLNTRRPISSSGMSPSGEVSVANTSSARNVACVDQAMHDIS